MPTPGSELDELKRWYCILDVPLTASARAIKLSYRDLVKRWHPDLYPDGTTAQAESTRMTALINEAYARIKEAPLRNCSEHSQPDSRNEGPASTERPKRDWVGFWVRFVCGCLFGAFLSFRVLVNFYTTPLLEPHRSAVTMGIGIAGTILGCGFGAALAGDKFWRSIRPRWY